MDDLSYSSDCVAEQAYHNAEIPDGPKPKRKLQGEHEADLETTISGENYFLM